MNAYVISPLFSFQLSLYARPCPFFLLPLLLLLLLIHLFILILFFLLLFLYKRFVTFSEESDIIGKMRTLTGFVTSSTPLKLDRKQIKPKLQWVFQTLRQTQAKNYCPMKSIALILLWSLLSLLYLSLFLQNQRVQKG